MFTLYRNPDLDDRIYDCLLTAMAAVQAADARASFLFVGDLNGHHQEWLGSSTTNRHGVATLEFATVSGCDRGSDHSSLSVAISMAQAIPNLCVSRKVLLKHRVNYTAFCDAIGVLPWRSIVSADNPVERLNLHLSLLVERFVPTKVIVCVTRISLGLMMTAGVHSTSSRGPIFGGLVIALELTGMSLSITRGGPMLYMPRLCVSLVSGAGMF